MGWTGQDAIMTHRQFLAWRHFLRAEWSNPSRTDHYLMQIAQEVRRVLSKHPKRILLKHFKIGFKWMSGAVKRFQTREQAAASARSWFSAWLGMDLEAEHQKQVRERQEREGSDAGSV